MYKILDNLTILNSEKSREKDIKVGKEGTSRKGDTSRETKHKGVGEKDTCMDVEKRTFASHG